MLAAFPLRKQTIAHYFKLQDYFIGLRKKIMSLNLNQLGQVKYWEIFVGRRRVEIEK